MTRQPNDPLTNPQPGDVVKLTDGNTASIRVREVMPLNRIDVNGIRRGSDYVQYRLDKYPGITMYMSVSGFKKRIMKVRNVAQQ